MPRIPAPDVTEREGRIPLHNEYKMRLALSLLFLMMSLIARPAFALDPKAVEALGTGESDEQVAAIAALVVEGDPRAEEVLSAMAEGDLKVAGKRVLIVRGDEAIDAASGEKVSPVPEDMEDIVANNRLRRELAGAIAALKLVSPDRAMRLAAARELSKGADEAILPLVKKAIEKEGDREIRPMLEMIAAAMEIRSENRDARLAAIRKLAESSNSNAKTLLLSILDKKDGAFV